MSTKSKKTKSKKSKDKKSKSSVDKTIISILSILFTLNGSVFAVLNVFIERQSWFAAMIIVSWIIGMALAFNSQKATIKWNRVLGMVSVGVIAASFLFFLIYILSVHLFNLIIYASTKSSSILRLSIIKSWRSGVFFPI